MFPLKSGGLPSGVEEPGFPDNPLVKPIVAREADVIRALNRMLPPEQQKASWEHQYDYAEASRKPDAEREAASKARTEQQLFDRLARGVEVDLTRPKGSILTGAGKGRPGDWPLRRQFKEPEDSCTKCGRQRRWDGVEPPEIVKGEPFVKLSPAQVHARRPEMCFTCANEDPWEERAMPAAVVGMGRAVGGIKPVAVGSRVPIYQPAEAEKRKLDDKGKLASGYQQSYEYKLRVGVTLVNLKNGARRVVPYYGQRAVPLAATKPPEVRAVERVAEMKSATGKVAIGKVRAPKPGVKVAKEVGAPIVVSAQKARDLAAVSVMDRITLNDLEIYKLRREERVRKAADRPVLCDPMKAPVRGIVAF